MHIKPATRFVFAAAMLTLLGAQASAQDTTAPTYREHLDLSYYLDANSKKHPIKIAADWEIRRGHLLAHMQIVMGELPKPATPVPLDMRVLEEIELPSDGENAGEPLVRKKITYHTDSRERVVPAYLFVPSNNRGKRPAVLCLHQTVNIGKQEPAGLGGNPNLHYAIELARRGYVTLAPDYPSFGDYEYNFRVDSRYQSGTMKAIYDNTRAVDLLQSLPEVAAERIGCIGHSLGGHNTMFTAAFDTRIKALVSNCGFTRFHKYYEGKLKGWTSDRYMPLIESRHHNNPDEVPFDFTEIVASFAPRAFLASAPVRDGNFEVSGVRDCIGAASLIYALYGKADNLQAIYPDSEHDFPPDARKIAYEFFDRHLKK